MTDKKLGGRKRRAYNRYKRRKANNKVKRIGQNLGKNVFWFKKCGDIKASGSDEIFMRITPNDTFPIPKFINTCRSFEQYKVLKVIVKFYPAYVGSESTTQTPTNNGFRRGNVITWIDQPPLGLQPMSGQIANLMGFPSSRLHQTRATIKRWMNRPSGGRTADWAYITHPTALGVPTVQPDPWNSEIRIFGDNFSTTPQNNKAYFFVEYLFKVVFRSEWRGGPPQ